MPVPVTTLLTCKPDVVMLVITLELAVISPVTVVAAVVWKMYALTKRCHS